LPLLHTTENGWALSSTVSPAVEGSLFLHREENA
jgi:hypothetical protein